MSDPGTNLSRRSFFKSLGATAAVGAAASSVSAVADELATANAESVAGPGPVTVALHVNGSEHRLALEPRVTLLDALRDHLDLTGSKEVCDRGSCGACTVLLDGEPAYACMLLAIDVQGRAITTVEGLAKPGALNKVQQAFVECDALMCGYCTPGFVVSLTALLEKNPSPSEAEVRKACSGNLCRCGCYPNIFEAAMRAAGAKTARKAPEVISLSHV